MRSRQSPEEARVKQGNSHGGGPYLVGPQGVALAVRRRFHRASSSSVPPHRPMPAAQDSSPPAQVTRKDASPSSNGLSLFKRSFSKSRRTKDDVSQNGPRRIAKADSEDTSDSSTVMNEKSSSVGGQGAGDNPGGSLADHSVDPRSGAGASQDQLTTNPSNPQAPTGQKDDTQSVTNEKDKNSSVNATLTGTATTSKHLKDKTASDTAHSASSEQPTSSATPSAKKDKRKKKKKKSSFFSKLASAVFKCTWPTDNAHSIDVDEGASGVSDPSSSAIQLEKTLASERGNNKPTSNGGETSEAPSLPPNLASQEPETPMAPAPAEEPVLTVAPDLVVPQSDDPAVVVPPSPTTQVLSEDVTAGMTSGAVQPPGSTGQTGREGGEESDNSTIDDDEDDKEMQEDDEEERLILNGGAGIPVGPDGLPRPLLPPVLPQHVGRKCLVLDLDETLVHSSFRSIQNADYVVPVEIEYHWHNVYVIKRPGVDNFLKKMGELYEVVVFTASLSKYADPVLDKLDIHQVVAHRLFRESCYNHKGNYVKDLSQLGRPIGDTIILDNSPASYIFHPNNAVPVSSWFNDPHDTELTDLCPFLADLRTVSDVRGVLDGGI